MAEQDFVPVFSSPVKMLSGELQPLLLHCGCQLCFFFAGMQDFNPNFLLSYREMVMIQTLIPFLRRIVCTFLLELLGEHAPILFVVVSSHAIVLRGLPLLFFISINPFCGEIVNCPLNG